MTIILICAGVLIFFVGFMSGGGWQRERDEKEIEELKQAKNMKAEDIPTVSYTDESGLRIHKRIAI